MYTQTKETQQSLTPAKALKILEGGNERFRTNLKANRDLLQQINETKDGQWPFAAIVSCIDSRTSVELIFDQSLGDVFSIRIAGNFINDDILGSLEFACAVAGAKLVVVLGHSECGAIKGACDHVKLGNLTQLLAKIEPAVTAVCETVDPERRGSANRELVQAVAEENVRRAVAGIEERSALLAELKGKGAIGIVGGMHDLATGTVRFFEPA